MFNWFDKLLVKIAKKILNKYAPAGEFIAYINEQEEKVLKKLGGYGQPINETGVKSFKSAWEYIMDAKEKYDKYKHIIDPIAKTATSIGKSYLDYKSQKELNELTEKAYKDYMLEKEAAGQEAQAAIDLNLTPMQISNIPTTKADVSDFTAVAARGGLMNLPQRKRYAIGTEQEDIEIMEPESLGDFELQMEEGVNIGEQVFHDTGDDRTNAQNVWQSGSIDQEIYQLDFEIFFKSGDWMDHISRGTVQGDTQMASDPSWEAEWDDMYENYKAKQISAGLEFVDKETFMMDYQDNMATGGIAGLRHGGRPGYQFGIGPQQGMMPQGLMPQGLMPQQGLMPNQMMAANGGRIGFNKGTKKMSMYQEYLEDVKEGFEGTYDDYVEMYYGKAHGGRIRKAPGGIMDLGGMEKDYRTTGGFVPLGGKERADDVPARLSKNEFVMTADAVRAAGGGSINKGAQRMYDTMKHLEASPGSKRMTA